MRVEVRYRCGHVGRAQIYGTSAERKRKAGWIERQLCPECKKADTLARAEIWERQNRLPEMDGTPAQVEWARQVRYKMFQDVDFKRRAPGEKELLLSRLGDKPARWWLDNRDEEPYWVFQGTINIFKDDGTKLQ